MSESKMMQEQTPSPAAAASAATATTAPRAGTPPRARTQAKRPARSRFRAKLRQVLFQLHWFFGITAGSLLVVIGLTGATLSFHEEILDLINPGVRQVAPRSGPMLTPMQIEQAVMQAHPQERINLIILQSAPGSATRVILATKPGERRGENIYVDPYSGAMQPPLRGADFFEWVEALHRWLLLPREQGRIVAGILAGSLLGMALSGLYVRWPHKPLNWRIWLTFNWSFKGRAFIHGLHQVAGTWVLLAYLISTTTGLYWAYDVIRDTVDGWAGIARPPRQAPMAPPAAAAKSDTAKGEATKSETAMAEPPKATDASGQTEGKPAGKKRGGEKSSGEKPVEGVPASDKSARGNAAGTGHEGAPHKPAVVDLEPAWAAFQRTAGAWQQANLRVPARANQNVELNWVATDAPHERARSRMTITTAGEVTKDERHSALGVGARAIATIYPLHMGTYFGIPGRLFMGLAALCLPLFAITGWMLYLQRRRVRRAHQKT